MTDQETAILLCGLTIALLMLMAIHFKRWALLSVVLIVAIFYFIIVAFVDNEEPREPNQTILEQLREKWRDKEGEPIDGSRN